MTSSSSSTFSPLGDAAAVNISIPLSVTPLGALDAAPVRLSSTATAGSSADAIDEMLLPTLIECLGGTPPPVQHLHNSSNSERSNNDRNGFRMSPCPFPLNLADCRSVSIKSEPETVNPDPTWTPHNKPAPLKKEDSDRSLIVPLPSKIATPSLQLQHSNSEISFTGDESTMVSVDNSENDEVANPSTNANMGQDAFTPPFEFNRTESTSLITSSMAPPPQQFPPSDTSPIINEGYPVSDQPQQALPLHFLVPYPTQPTVDSNFTAPQPMDNFNLPINNNASSSELASFRSSSERVWEATAAAVSDSFQPIPSTPAPTWSINHNSVQQQPMLHISPGAAPPPQSWPRPSSTIIPINSSSSATTIHPSTKRMRMETGSRRQSMTPTTSSSVDSSPASASASANGKPARAKLVGENRLKIKFLSLGHLGDTPQHFGKKRNRIPDGLSGIHEVYNQRWRFEIHHHKKSPNDLTTITWSITNLASGTTLTRTETPHEAFLREFKGQTICNQLMRDAIQVRAQELEKSLEENKDKPSKLANIKSCLRCLRPKKCIMGLLFFGLLHECVQDHLRAEEQHMLGPAARASDGTDHPQATASTSSSNMVDSVIVD